MTRAERFWDVVVDAIETGEQMLIHHQTALEHTRRAAAHRGIFNIMPRISEMSRATHHHNETFAVGWRFLQRTFGRR